MEYEIGDDPQGLPERSEGNRDGGLRESLLFGQTERPETIADRKEDPIKGPGQPG